MCVARAAFGSGPNVVGTVLLVVLSYKVQQNYTLGARLMPILDNTSEESKCNAVVGAPFSFGRASAQGLIS